MTNRHRTFMVVLDTPNGIWNYPADSKVRAYGIVDDLLVTNSPMYIEVYACISREYISLKDQL